MTKNKTINNLLEEADALYNQTGKSGFAYQRTLLNMAQAQYKIVKSMALKLGLDENPDFKNIDELFEKAPKNAWGWQRGLIDMADATYQLTRLIVETEIKKDLNLILDF